MTFVSISRVALGAAMALGVSALAAAAQSAAEPLVIEDAYARVATPQSPNGAIFMMIRNPRDVPVHIAGVTSDLAMKTELHTHIAEGDGVMRMVHVEDGFTVPANGTLHLRRGAEHVMLMGLNAPLVQGATVSLTLLLDGMDDLAVEAVVDNERQDQVPMMMDHGTMDHGAAGTMDKM